MFRIILIFAALGLGAAGYSAYWWILSDQLRAGAARQIAAWHAQGIHVEPTGLNITGYPYRLSAATDVLTVAAPNIARPWQWRGQRVDVVAQPWNLKRWIGRVRGPSTLHIGSGDTRTDLDIQPQRALASLRLDGTRQVRELAVDIGDATIANPAHGATYRLGRAQLHARLVTSPGGDGGDNGTIAEIPIQTVIRLDNLALPPALAGALGADIAAVTADLLLTGPAPNALSAPALRAWRGAGGQLQVRQADILWGKVDARARGILSLDEGLRPAGELTARIRGATALVRDLHQRGLISDDGATALDLVIALATQEDANGEAPFVELPLTARDGALFLGPVPLVALPSLTSALQ